MAKLTITTRGSNLTVRLPTSQAIGQAMEIATTAESASYLREHFSARLEQQKGNLEQGRPMINAVSNHCSKIEMLDSIENRVWDAVAPQTNNFQALQQLSIKESLEALPLKQVNMAFAISEDSEFSLGFSTPQSGGTAKVVSPEERIQLEQLLNAFLAQSNPSIQVKDSAFYEGSPDGKISLDSQGKEIKAEPEKVAALIEGKFPTFMAENGIESRIQQRNFPGQAPQVTLSQQSENSPLRSANVQQEPAPSEGFSPRGGR